MPWTVPGDPVSGADGPSRASWPAGRTRTDPADPAAAPRPTRPTPRGRPSAYATGTGAASSSRTRGATCVP